MCLNCDKVTFYISTILRIIGVCPSKMAPLIKFGKIWYSLYLLHDLQNGPFVHNCVCLFNAMALSACNGQYWHNTIYKMAPQPVTA